MSNITFAPFLGLRPENINISNSEITEFTECPRKWMLSTYYGLRSKVQSVVGPLPLGSRIHNAFERYYGYGEDLLEAYAKYAEADQELFDRSNEASDPERRRAFESEAELGRIMLEGYMEWITEGNLDAGLEILGAEEFISYTMPEFGGRVTLIGKLDLMVKNKLTGFVGALDFKSAASFDSYYYYTLMSVQFKMYALIMHLTENVTDPVSGGIYRLLKKNKRTARAKPPFYEELTVNYNDATLDSYYQRMISVVKQIVETRDRLDAGEDHRLVAYPNPTDKCSWKCPFYQGCTMLDDGSRADDWLHSLFEQIDPLARYNDNGDTTNE